MGVKGFTELVQNRVPSRSLDREPSDSRTPTAVAVDVPDGSPVAWQTSNASGISASQEYILIDGDPLPWFFARHAVEIALAGASMPPSHQSRLSAAQGGDVGLVGLLTHRFVTFLRGVGLEPHIIMGGTQAAAGHNKKIDTLEERAAGRREDVQMLERFLGGLAAPGDERLEARGLKVSIVSRAVNQALQSLNVLVESTMAEADIVLEKFAARYPPYAAVMGDDTDLLLLPGARVVRLESIPLAVFAGQLPLLSQPAPLQQGTAPTIYPSLHCAYEDIDGGQSTRPWVRSDLRFHGAADISAYLTTVVRAFGAQESTSVPHLQYARISEAHLQDIALLCGVDYTKSQRALYDKRSGIRSLLLPYENVAVGHLPFATGLAEAAAIYLAVNVCLKDVATGRCACNRGNLPAHRPHLWPSFESVPAIANIIRDNEDLRIGCEHARSRFRLDDHHVPLEDLHRDAHGRWTQWADEDVRRAWAATAGTKGAVIAPSVAVPNGDNGDDDGWEQVPVKASRPEAAPAAASAPASAADHLRFAMFRAAMIGDLPPEELQSLEQRAVDQTDVAIIASLVPHGHAPSDMTLTRPFNSVMMAMLSCPRVEDPITRTALTEVLLASGCPQEQVGSYLAALASVSYQPGESRFEVQSARVWVAAGAASPVPSSPGQRTIGYGTGGPARYVDVVARLSIKAAQLPIAMLAALPGMSSIPLPGHPGGAAAAAVAGSVRGTTSSGDDDGEEVLVAGMTELGITDPADTSQATASASTLIGRRDDAADHALSLLRAALPLARLRCSGKAAQRKTAFAYASSAALLFWESRWLDPIEPNGMSPVLSQLPPDQVGSAVMQLASPDSAAGTIADPFPCYTASQLTTTTGMGNHPVLDPAVSLASDIGILALRHIIAYTHRLSFVPAQHSHATDPTASVSSVVPAAYLPSIPELCAFVAMLAILAERHLDATTAAAHPVGMHTFPIVMHMMPSGVSMRAVTLQSWYKAVAACLCDMADDLGVTQRTVPARQPHSIAGPRHAPMPTMQAGQPDMPAVPIASLFDGSLLHYLLHVAHYSDRVRMQMGRSPRGVGLPYCESPWSLAPLPRSSHSAASGSNYYPVFKPIENILMQNGAPSSLLTRYHFYWRILLSPFANPSAVLDRYTSVQEAVAGRYLPYFIIEPPPPYHGQGSPYRGRGGGRGGGSGHTPRRDRDGNQAPVHSAGSPGSGSGGGADTPSSAGESSRGRGGGGGRGYRGGGRGR